LGCSSDIVIHVTGGFNEMIFEIKQWIEIRILNLMKPKFCLL